jgi:predicted small lipoprotein YifL
MFCQSPFRKQVIMRLLFLLVAMLLLVPSCGAFGPVALPSADAATPTITTRLPASTLLTDRDMLTLLADDVYHTNISSIAEGQDARSYIGEETTVSQDEEESGGRSWLRTKLQALVGKLLTWRTRPIYDKLQGILDDDLMPLVHQRMAMLVARPTGFEEVALTNGGTSSTTNDSAERTAFGSDDGACTGKVAAWKGGRIDWITTARFFHGQKGFGNMRLDGWSSRDTRAPHLALHLCAIFDTMFIYVSLHPRANLVLDDDYNDYGRFLLVCCLAFL